MEVEPFFEVHEVDLDYEFDAAMCFDFTRPETQAETLQAELWFQSAQEYPPSPFVAKLEMREDILMENVNTSPKSKDMESIMDADVGVSRDFCALDTNNKDCEGIVRGIFTKLQSSNLQKVTSQQLELTTEMTFYNHTSTDKLKTKMKSTVKPSLPRSSTLMKPTASQLAKQNRPLQVAVSRFQTQLVQQSERSLHISSGVESQASKRQKLEGGHLGKVTESDQQSSLVHKLPKKEETVDKNSAYSTMRLTIPRQPELETAHRAQRIRPKDNTKLEQVKSAARIFKARPLNRKILEAPSLPLPKKSTPKLPEFQEFHLKTLERAMQHTSALSSSSVRCNDSDKVGLDKAGTSSFAENVNKEYKRLTSTLFRPSTMDAPKQNECNVMHHFKARPLNKKILSSKGDIGVFRNSKRQATLPMEFNFHTEKRSNNNPPTELFSKLSLASGLQPSNGSQPKLPQPNSLFLKGSKENRSNHFQLEHEKEKPSIFGGKQFQCGSDGCISEAGVMRLRSLGIR
ncbi:protein TPX2-like isoform X4 [Carya illinoinensis]|uniref:protein TPX2-like isoform X4 n=1 Tax=Carya illinoinensis TaxID=32201 RepID=UPI001C7220E3|nr:protein TPX2-like isoform X4 [Carya illinoinensis]